MKKIAFFILISITTSLVFGQSLEDMQTVLQICIEQDDLQKYYHKQTIEGKHHLVIRDDGIVPAYLQVEKFGNLVLFLSVEQLFFWDIRDPLIFRKFKIAKDTADLEFERGEVKEVITISFTKSNDGWIVKEKQVK